MQMQSPSDVLVFVNRHPSPCSARILLSDVCCCWKSSSSTVRLQRAPGGKALH